MSDRLIEIKGVQFSNKGAELMLVAIEQKLKSELSDYQLALSPRNSPYLKRVQYHAKQKIGNLFKRVDWSYLDFLIPEVVCRNYGLAKHHDIDIVLDASGFAYGEQWTPSMLAHSVRQAKLMKAKNKDYIFMPQAFGPFESDKYKKLLNEAVDNCSLMFVRDKMSYKYVTDIVGEREDVILSPDFTNLVRVEGVEPAFRADDELQVLTIIPNGKMLSKQNNNSFTGKDYVDEFIKAARYAQDLGYYVVVLNHEGDGDFKICEKIYSALKPNNRKLISDLSAIEVKSQISQSTLVLCSRFHGCVSALSQGIPVVATSWSHKYEMLFEGYDVSNLLYHFDTPLVEFVAKTVDELDTIKEMIEKNASIEKLKAESMWKEIYSKIKK